MGVMLTPYLLSNALAIALVVVARKAPRLARGLLATGFVVAAVFNLRTAVADPGSYLSFATTAIPPYPWLIEHVFAQAPRTFILAIAGVQLVGALLLVFGDRRIARIGAGTLVAFLIAIAPLGLGSAFPATLVLAAAVWLAVREGQLPRTAAPGTGRVLVAHGSKRGGTREIAERIAETLRGQHLAVDCRPAALARVDDYDVVIIGGALYAGRWVRDASRFVRRNADSLRVRTVWMFSSGPLDDSAETLAAPRAVAQLVALAGARGHVTFGGRLAPDAHGFPASALAKQHAGDWRDWERIRSWALDLARALDTEAPSRALPVAPPERGAAPEQLLR